MKRKTPHASMSAAITENIKTFGEASPFEKIGKIFKKIILFQRFSEI
jgi:hypothetical protein